MDFNTIDKIPDSFQNRPQRTILILSIVAVVALIGVLFSGCLSDLGKHKKTIACYEKALADDLRVYGEQHPEVAIEYNNLGTA
jgi:hypothetical protein